MIKDTSYSSMWLYDNRVKLPKVFDDVYAKSIGRKSLTGKDNYSKFNASLCKKIISFWSNKGDVILDLFAGRTRAFVSIMIDRNYTGFDVSKKVCNFIKKVGDVND